MVSPARLVATLSQVTGVPLATVTEFDRRLVTAGLRAKAGRGLNAARMTVLDAARLLTAILASPQASATADAVRRYQATSVDTAHSSTGLFGTLGLADIAELTPTHSFVDGLVGLLSSASRGALAALCASLEEAAPPQIEVFAFTRATRGRIRIAGMPDGATAALEYRPATSAPAMRAAEKAGGDLEQSRRISEWTILAVASLLAEEDGDGQ